MIHNSLSQLTLGAKRTGTRNGSVLVTTLVSLLFVFTFGSAILALSLNGLSSTRRIRANTKAFNLAESGLERATRWFKEQASPPSYSTPFQPIGGVQSSTDGQYLVTAYPDANNSGAVLKKYVLIGEGTNDGRTESIKLVIRQTSFGKYAYFTDRETSSVSGGRIWFFSGDRIRGPAHSNNNNGSEFQINYGASPGPIFEGMVTSSGNFINYAPTNPTTEAQFSQIYRAGSRGYELGVDDIPLPNSSDVQKDAAWGANGAYPTVTGVYTPPGGGIYIKGNSTVQLLVDGGGRQQFRVVQGANTTTLTIDKAANVMYKSVNGGATTVAGSAGSGVLYSADNITALSGTIANNVVSGGTEVLHRNSYTIATDVNAGRTITVTNPIVHQSAYNPAQATNSPGNLLPGTLGLIARNVTIGPSAPTNMEIDAVILAGSQTTTDGSFGVSNYNTKTPTGNLKVVGGIIQKARGPVGTLSGSTLATGYAKDYYYDARMADNPPPFFPTTGGYDKISWRRIVE